MARDLRGQRADVGVWRKSGGRAADVREALLGGKSTILIDSFPLPKRLSQTLLLYITLHDIKNKKENC